MKTLISEFEPKTKMQKSIDPFLEKEQLIQINLKARNFLGFQKKEGNSSKNSVN